MAEAGVGAGQEFQGVLLYGHPDGMAGASLAFGQMFLDTLCQCCSGEIAEIGIDVGQGISKMHWMGLHYEMAGAGVDIATVFCAGAALVRWMELEPVQTGGTLGGWLELLWARGLKLTAVALAGWLEHLDIALVCTIKVKGKCKQWHLPALLTPERVPAVFYTIWQMF